jgi:hypothetical protein
MDGVVYVRLPDGRCTVARIVSFEGEEHTLSLPPDGTTIALSVYDTRWADIDPAGECCACTEESRSLVWHEGCACARLHVCAECASAKHPDGRYKIVRCPVCRRETGARAETRRSHIPVSPLYGPLASYRHMVRVLCKPPGGPAFEVMVHPLWTVETFKAIVHSRWGYQQDYGYRLMCAGKGMQEPRPLASCGVADDSTIHLVPSLRGD